MHALFRIRTLLPVFILVGLSLLAGCGPAEPPPVVSIEQACAPENDGKPASVIGYFQSDFMIFCTDTCTLDFADKPGGESPLSPYITVGTGANQMRELPDNFQASDFQVTAHDGTTVGLSDRVQISGTMTIAPSVCLMEVNQISAAP